MTSDLNREISLLAGFDSIRAYLHEIWLKSGRKSDDVANLLSSMDRDVEGNGPPLDAAQWSDWLDALIAVRPDLSELKQARRSLQDAYEEFDKIRQTGSLERRKMMLDEYRARLSMQSWHRVGAHLISTFDAYKAMREFLLAYWNRGERESDELRAILETLNRQDRASDAQEMEWLLAVRSATVGKPD